jgi:hypothetical protein
MPSNTVTTLLIARIVKPADTVIAWEQLVNISFARQWLSRCHVNAAALTSNRRAVGNRLFCADRDEAHDTGRKKQLILARDGA